MARQKSRDWIPTKGNVALCYIRQSRTIDADDTNSPKRQRDNIQRVCAENGWIPEWYEDVGGHRSGRSEKQRPEWVALKRRLSDPDVVALVANDLSRLHRNLAGMTLLLEQLERHKVMLVLAANRDDIDLTTLTGQLSAQIRGLMDAFYAKDVSIKSIDNIDFRKREGKTIGMPPFGTIRNQDGYHMPTPRGAWLLPDGTFQTGEVGQEPPVEGALWRGYYECAHLILTKYVTQDIGMQRLAYEMNILGWAFRDRYGTPRPITEDDVRRVLSNWPEYGGLVFDDQAKDRKAYEELNVDEIAFIEERAVFPLDLLRSVARNRQERSVRPINHGVNRDTYPYPLSGLLYCAHCENLAKKHRNPRLRSHLGGAENHHIRRYRHKPGVRCGSKARSIRCDVLEQDFGSLISLLTVKPDMLHLMTELAIQSDHGFDSNQPNLEAEKKAAIALRRRRIDAAINLYRDGVISREDYLADVERNQREIAHWEARTTETEKAALELAMCIAAVEKLEKLWRLGTDEERQGMARSLFSEMIIDLDASRIVDFKLKPWADRFLTIRATLYEVDDQDSGDSNPTTQSEGTEQQEEHLEDTDSIGTETNNQKEQNSMDNKGDDNQAADENSQSKSTKGAGTDVGRKPVWGTSRFSP